MKAKTNLELFKNEMIYNLKHGTRKSLYDAMVSIYVRECPVKVINYENLLNWFSDEPRETLYLSEFAYKFIKEYFNKLKEYKIWMVKEPLNDIICLDVLIKIGVIPSRYSQTPLDEFMQIIRLKDEKK